MTENTKKYDEYRSLCTCGQCPTYNECMRADQSLIFCFLGKAVSCTFGKKGCLCPVCPVTKTFGWKKAYYCIKGSAEDQG